MILFLKKYVSILSKTGYTFEQLSDVLKKYSIAYRRENDKGKVRYHEKQSGSILADKISTTHPNYPELTADRSDNTEVSIFGSIMGKHQWMAMR